MRRVEDIADEIIAREGGFANDPDDPGGATKHGVTIGTLKRLGLDLTRDGRVDEADVRRVTPAEARRIFIEEYFRKPRLDRLPAALQPQVFDMQVNAGAEAVRILQRLLERMGYPCSVDGIVGPETERAARAAAMAAPDHFAHAYGIERRSFYYDLGDRRPSSRKYARRRDGGKGGWILRAESFIAPRYHLTEDQHRERTKAWA